MKQEEKIEKEGKTDPVAEILELSREDSLLDGSIEDWNKGYATLCIHSALNDLERAAEALGKGNEKNKQLIVKGVIAILEPIMEELIDKSIYNTLTKLSRRKKEKWQKIKNLFTKSI